MFDIVAKNLGENKRIERNQDLVFAGEFVIGKKTNRGELR